MHVGCVLGPTGMALAADKADFALVDVGERHVTDCEPHGSPFLMGARIARHLGRAWFGTTVVDLAHHNPQQIPGPVADRIRPGHLTTDTGALAGLFR